MAEEGAEEKKDAGELSALEYQVRLNSIYQRIKEAESFQAVAYQLEQDMLALLGAERLTIYQKDPNGGEIVSIYRTGDDGTEIRVPMSPASISGYVAMSQKPIRVDDVYDAEALSAIHESLTFDSTYDQASGFLTQAMVVVPIKSRNTLLGVLQLINKAEGGPFDDQDVIHALAVANVIAQQFRYDLNTTEGPFDLLVKQKRISPDFLAELEEKAAAEHLPLTYLLRTDGTIPPEVIGQSLEQFYQVPFLGFIPDLKPDPTAMESLNVDYLAKNHWVPFVGEEGSEVVLLANPNDADKIMEIQHLLNAQSYDFRVGTIEDIYAYLGLEIVPQQEIKPGEAGTDDILKKMEDAEKKKAEEAARKKKKKGEIEEGADEGGDLMSENESSVIQLVNRMIVDAVEMNASDIHIEPNPDKKPARVRMRVDGVCREVLLIPETHIQAVIARIKVLSRLDIAERRKPQDGKIGVKLSGSPLELRVAILPTINGESAILRVLARGEPLPFEKLNFSEHNLKMIEECLEKPHGIFLVVGPTGSGKTTTLHGVLGHLNTPDVKIVTAEDPVEITQKGLQQVQVQAKIGFDFAMALRAFLRADPDIILIGEMRDYETAHAGIEASLTGHMVFSTLHTNSAPETVTRLLDMGLDPMNFSDSLIGILAQRLVRTLCKKCKEPYTPTAEEVDKLIHHYGEEDWAQLNLKREDIRLHRAKGCPACGNTGYKGRTGVHELLASSVEMRKLIVSKSSVHNIRALAMKEGMRTLMQDGIYKILKGDIDWEQLHEVTVE